MVENDRGEIIAKCDNCSDIFKIQTINPHESYIVYGAEKVDEIDFDIQPASDYKPIQGLLQFDGDLNEQIVTYDVSSKPLYCCKSCNNSLEDYVQNKKLRRHKFN